jgi:parallel beta helix pectate lyase-like protein
LGMLFLIGYVVSGGVAQAATYYVSKAGSDNYSCAAAQSVSTPRLTINAGIGCLSAGDTLLIRAGSYDEVIKDNAVSGTSWTNKVRIAAYPGETVWLAPSGGDSAVYLNSSQAYVEFDGINMQGSVPGCVFYMGPTTHHIRLQNAEIVNNQYTGYCGNVGVAGTDSEFLNLTVDGLGGQYAFYVKGDRNIIDRCDMHHVDGGGVHIYSSGGNPTGNIVRNSRIHDISTYHFFDNPNDPRRFGILISGTANLVYNNIIYGVTGGDTANNKAISVWWGNGHKVYNNTVVNNATIGIAVDTDATSADVRNNIVYGNTGGAQFMNLGANTTASNNLFGVDPLFADPSTNNFQLRATSRAIDAGVSLSIVTTDIAGVPRPQGSAPDIGSYEYRAQQAQPTAPAPPTGVRIVSN